MTTFAGLQADARMLIDKVRMECQSFRFNYEDEPSIEYIARFMAETQQKATQKGGVRPYGITMFLTGFQDGKPCLFQTEPSGALSQWKASAIGKKQKETIEYLENKYEEGQAQEKCVNLAVETLLEVVESAKNMEICVVKPANVTEFVSEDVVQGIVDKINQEKEAKEAEKKAKSAAAKWYLSDSIT